MSIYIILPLISGIFVLFCGLLVLGKNRKLKVNQIFFFFTVAVAIWLLATFVMFLSKTDEQAIFWDRIVYIGVVFIPITFYHFVLLFTKIKNQKRLLYLGYFLSFIFLILSRTNYFLEALYKYNWGVHTQARFFHHIFLAFFASYICLSFSNIYRYYRQTKGIERMQTAYILLVLFIITLNSLAFLPAYNISISPLFSYLPPVITVLILSFAIIKYHLFEIKVILTEILVGVMGLILMVLPFLMPSIELRFLTGFVLFLFILLGYLLIKYTYSEINQREKAEVMAIRERTLREEMEKLNKELQSAYKNIEALSNIKSEFLKIVNHQLRTPVSIVMSYLSMLQEGSIEGEQKVKKTINNTYLASQRLIIILDDLLNAQELIGEKPILNLRFCQIEELIEEVIEHFKLFADEKKLMINFQKPKEPFPQILLDGARIERALKKLLDNAILYTPKGKITISANLIKEEEKRFAQIQVRDTGIGIIEEDKKKLFKPFSRGEEGLKMHPNGSGLGLFIAKENIEGHQGKLKVESEGKNKGTTFTITLPIDTKI